ncbi:MAG: substrate-binding domain-containing protein [Geminicoccaceae bacterium]
MHKTMKHLASLALSVLLLAPGAAPAQEEVDSGLTVYFQLGGNPGDTATLARELGARAAARVLNVDLIEQHSGWNPQKMLTQANEALAAQPDAIIVMGHPGTDAMTSFINKAKADGITVIVNNNALPGAGLSYFGLDNHGAGRNLANLTIDNGGLSAGDKVVVYGAFIEGAPGADVAKGTMEVLNETGIVADQLQWSNEAVADPSLSIPVLIAYLESNPETKAIIVPGHGGITAVLDKVLQGAGKAPGEVIASGFDLSSAAIQGVKDGYITVILDQQPYLQGFLPVLAAVLEVKYGLAGLNLNTGGGALTMDNRRSDGSPHQGRHPLNDEADQTMTIGPIVRLEKVGKTYGKIVGLVGDNGAGKSTLIKVLTGVEPPSSGSLYIRGEKIDTSSYDVSEAHKLRLETVYQDKSLGEKQPLWRNFFVGRPITNWLGFIDVQAEKKIAEHIMRNAIGFRGAGIDVDTPVSRLSGGERQGVAIGRAMHFDSDLIVLDEPTVALALKEVRKALDFIRSIKAGGRSCIYIEHNIHHIHEVCDRVIVLDRGRLVLDTPISDITYTELSDYLLSLHTETVEVE